ncbi:MAG TPA: DNA methyltransferase, partial [Alphaproteobacteria bacterium]|nr:DNA methyltransferase [Alphaproteobacteria bacterium]
MREDERRSRPLAKSFRRRLSSAEAILWSRLKGRQFFGLHVRRQHPIGPYIADFACGQLMLVIELDGDQHGLDENRRHDEARDDFIREQGWRIVRIGNAEVYKNLSGVLDGLSVFLIPPPPTPPPPPPG